MPTIQGNFPLKQDAGIPGGTAMSRYASDTGIVEGAPIAFGAPVMRGTDREQLKTLAAGGGAFLGIARQKRGGLLDRHEVGSTASYITTGQVYAIADAAVAADAVVRFNTATGRYTSAAASATVIECTGWVFETPATGAGGLVIIKRA